MNIQIFWLILAVMIGFYQGCTSEQTSSSDPLTSTEALDDPNAGDLSADTADGSQRSGSEAQKNDESYDFGDDNSKKNELQSQAQAQAPTQQESIASAKDTELKLEEELKDASSSTGTAANEAQEKQMQQQQEQAEDPFKDITQGKSLSEPKKEEVAKNNPNAGDDLTLDDPNTNPNSNPNPVASNESNPSNEPTLSKEPTPSKDPAPSKISDSFTGSSSLTNPVNVTGLKFKSNDAGGTVLIELDSATTYSTRKNSETNQFIVEVQNSNLPTKLKRPLNTKDMKGSIGAVDAYQNANSNVSRFVIQLRKGAAEPTVQMEGNTILVLANKGQDIAEASRRDLTKKDREDVAMQSEQNFESQDMGKSGSASHRETHDGKDPSTHGIDMAGDSGTILQSHNLSDFLSGNQKFYGRKISIEYNDVDVRDALKFILQESGANMVIGEEVKGKISLKLRQTPWDQALVTIMKTKKLGYTRQGNVLRIAPQAELKQEEDETMKLAIEKKRVEPLKVRMYPVNYAKVEEIGAKIKDFLSERGRAAADPRTNYLVVSDIEESLERVAKLITSLDVQPQQVLIEGKIVEAKESFTHQAGISWSLSGSPTQLTKGRSPLTLTPSLDLNSTPAGDSVFRLQLGTLDLLGDLTTTLALAERDDIVRVISSPRVVTLTNEKAVIRQSTELPYREAQAQVTGVVQPVSTKFKKLELHLDVTPQITTDGSVIMQVDVARETPGAAVNANDGSFSVNSRNATTKVLVKNGQTAVIGGVFQNDHTEVEDGVPYLKDIPGIGMLFKNKSTRREKLELLVFITPRILNQIDSQAIPTDTKEAL